MKIRIKRKARWIKLIMGINILLWYHFFYLFPLLERFNLFIRKDHLTFINVFAYVLILIYLALYHKHVFKIYDKIIAKYLLVLFLAYFIEIVYTIIKYPLQTFSNTLMSGANFLQLLAIPIYLYIFETDEGEDRFLSFLDDVAFIWCVILVIQSTFYNATGSFLFDFRSYFFNYSDSNYIATRIYGIRVGVGCVGNFTILYNFSKLYNNEVDGFSKVYTFIKIIIEFYAIVVVQQTRAWMLIVLACIATQIIMGNKSGKTRILESIGLIIVTFILIFFGILNNFLSQFNAMTVATHGVSSSNRLYAINYYLHTFIKRPILGNGFTSSGSKIYSAVEHGSLGIAYYVDVGIFGLLAQTGLLSIIFYFYPYIKSIKVVTSMKLQKKKLGSKYNLDISILIYLTLSSFTLLITNNGLEPLFPIIIAIFLYQRKIVTSK